MDWFSNRKFVIVCHEKVVRIPLEGDEILRVHGERTQGVVKTLMNTKSKEEHEVHLKLVLESLRKEKLYAKHPQADGQSERMIQTLEDIMRAFVIDFGGSYHLSIRCAPFEALCGRKCRSPVQWAEIRESSLTGLELVQETTNKVTPWKGVVHFGKEGKLAPRYVGLFEILERIGLVAYRLRLPEELTSVHDTFHVSNLKKCLEDSNLHVPLNEIKVDKTLHFVEEPVEIMDQEIKKLKRRKIALVKVRWDSKRGPEFTWEHEDQMRIKYPQLFVVRVVEPAS
ncbi:putative reverse transcriptase domain-containing protein [Tanacetum coccineum]|uniref:Reverse transcriptase domain-containing protein n=1 Tax=Tanacetum coccineum TaxID=301880 RepID=A0ABQ4YA07_9ASTR